MDLEGVICVLCKHAPHDHVQTMVGVRCIAASCACRFFAAEMCHLCHLPIPLRALKRSPLRRSDDHVTPLSVDPKSCEIMPAHVICNGIRGNALLDTYVHPQWVIDKVSRMLYHQHPAIIPWKPCADASCQPSFAEFRPTPQDDRC